MTHPTPNILFLFTDQLRADCIAAHGNRQIKTPNIDRLVNEGTTFTNAITPSPVCMPARHSLTCGAPPHQTGCVDNLRIQCERPSFMNSLNRLGYHTHGIGKMHFAPHKGDWGFKTRDYSEELLEDCDQDDYRDFLQDNGYDHVIDPHGFRSEFYYLPQPSQLPDKLHNNAWVADKSIEFLENHDKSTPFFLWSSFIKPHPPFESPTPWSRLYRMHEMAGPHLPEGYEDQRCFWNQVQCRYKYLDSGYSTHLSRMIKAAYYSTISHLDFHLGRILDALGDEIDNTLIVFSSDHGEMLGDYGCYGKRTMLRPSASVPLIARFPKAFAAGGKCEHAASLLDLFPTFVEMAGGDTSEQDLEGINLNDLQQHQHKSRFVYSQFSQNQLGLYMISNHEWKYIYSAADDKEWLYHFGDEDNNLAKRPEFSDVLLSLKDKLIQRFAKDGYAQPIENHDWRRFPPVEFPSDPNEGLLFQDPNTLDERLAAMDARYHRPPIEKTHDKFQFLRSLVQRSKLTFEDFLASSSSSK